MSQDTATTTTLPLMIVCSGDSPITMMTPQGPAGASAHRDVVLPP